MTTNITAKAAIAAQAIVQTKANVLFDLADNQSASIQASLVALGIATRADAKPFCLQWAAKKYHAKIEQGQRGDKLPRDSAAEKAMHRVLSGIYGSDNPFIGKGGKKASDEPEALPRGLKAGVKAQIIGAGLTKGQFNALLKALREEITFA